MKVIYLNGTEGNLSGSEYEDFTIEGRITKQAWEELEKRMNQLGIIKFEDSFLKQLGFDMVTIEFVRNQIIVRSRV